MISIKELAQFSIETLIKFTNAELKDIIKKNGGKGYSNKKKAELAMMVFNLPLVVAERRATAALGAARAERLGPNH